MTLAMVSCPTCSPEEFVAPNKNQKVFVIGLTEDGAETQICIFSCFKKIIYIHIQKKLKEMDKK